MRRDILRSQSFLVLVYLMASATFGADPDQSWKIHGRVIDEHDQPTDDFDAATFWWSNGNQWDANGERIKPSGPDDMAKMWKDEGTPAADPKELAARRRWQIRDQNLRSPASFDFCGWIRLASALATSAWRKDARRKKITPSNLCR